MIYPEYEEFESWAGDYKIGGVLKEISGDTETPITLFKKFEDFTNSFLLESVEGGERRGRYTYMGRNPFMEIKAYGDRVLVKTKEKTIKREGEPLGILKEILHNYNSPYTGRMPDFTGGAVGYIAYDVAENYMGIFKKKEDEVGNPDLHFILSKELIVYDHVKQRIILIVNSLLEGNIKEVYKGAIERLRAMENEIKRKVYRGQKLEKQGGLPLNYKANETRASFIEKVNRAKEYIVKGEVNQLVLSQRLEVDTDLDAFQVYRQLRGVNPSPYLFYINFGDYQIVGSSPEIMVKVKNKKVFSCPIAGTRPRGRNLAEDEKLKEELLADKKEVAEHLMLVDLAREDLRKICKEGKIQLEDYMEVHKYSHVMHIVTNLVGDLKDGHDMFDATMACMPAGTLSGTPKVRAMELIGELENSRRGFYGGAVGYFAFNGNMDTCIAIRSILFKGNKAYLQGGAGIVADSIAEKEYYEVQKKFEALIETLERSGGNRKFREVL